MTEPTPQDIRNSAARRLIAERQQAEFDAALAWTEAVFGPGWNPCGRHYLLDHDTEDRCRRTGERAVPAAQVFTARNAAGDKRPFVIRDGTPVEVSGYEEGFGAMLREPDPMRGFTDQAGVFRHVHRYSLCWAPIEPGPKVRSADQLAAARQTRERRKAERADAAWMRDNPLFADFADEGRGR